MDKPNMEWPSGTNEGDFANVQESDTASVAYEACRSSGVLSFWDDPEEDMYEGDTDVAGR